MVTVVCVWSLSMFSCLALLWHCLCELWQCCLTAFSPATLPLLPYFCWASLALVSLFHLLSLVDKTDTRLTALFPGLPRWAGTRKVKPIWILLKQETVSGSGINWAICKSAPCSRQITTPVPHHSVFYRPDALPAALPAQPTASKHWRDVISR